MNILDFSFIMAIKLADVVITEIIDPVFEDPIKLKHARTRLPIALRFIDIERFKVLKTINERKYDIGFIGRLEPEKGLQEFIRAIKILYVKGYDPHVLIAGGGSLINLARKVSNEINATVLSYVPHNQMPGLYNEVKILVLPSKKEGVPTVLLEALACGVIPVVSKVGGIPWLIQKANVGIIMDDPCYKSIYSALEYLLNLKPEELENLSQKSRKFIENYFAINKAIARYSVLREILI
jgi:glycosyltransferase involved in cell wall biosynthesis